MLNVKIDISENARFMDKVSVMGVATDDGTYKKNRVLYPKVKKRIKNYAGSVNKIHAIMIYKLIKNEMKKYDFLHICCDVDRNKLKNNLRKIFSDCSYWQELDQGKK